MTWRTPVQCYDTADMASAIPTVHQGITIGTANKVLRAIVAGLAFYAQPAFTTLVMELWSDNGGSPGVKIATSTNSFVPADCYDAGKNGVYRFMGFEFPLITLRAGAKYHIALRASSYTGDFTTNMAWRFAYPNPQYAEGVTLNAASGARFPLEASIVSADL